MHDFPTAGRAMTNRAVTTAVAVGFLFVLGCSGNGVHLSQLDGKSFTLVVDRIARNPEVQFPFEELPEAEYEQTSQGNQYDVSFSDNPERVTVTGQPLSEDTLIMRGNLEAGAEDLRHYPIVEGLFAGGRFNVWIADGHFEAELTVYGSGVPIIKSERGKLVPTE